MPEQASETLTAQEIFDTVAAHLRKQGHRALEHGDRGPCVYRAADGSKCAVGCLIRDEEYTERMDIIQDLDEVVDAGLLPARLVPHLELLRDLQNAHDNACAPFLEVIEDKLKFVAERNGLTYRPA